MIVIVRPKKWRRVEFLPNIRYFSPKGIPKNELQENVLKIEELESLRLKDLEGLEQQTCAEKMGVSRQTFQRILKSAQRKVADSLINGKAIRIEGGNFTRNICLVRCESCGREWNEGYENFKKVLEEAYICPHCGSIDVVCNNDFEREKKFCKGNCWRHGRNK